MARRASGNPFFIEELAAAVREHGAAEVPANAREVIVARVDRLPASTKATLQRAAVIGPTCRSRILEELVGAAERIEGSSLQVSDRPGGDSNRVLARGQRRGKFKHHAVVVQGLNT